MIVFLIISQPALNDPSYVGSVIAVIVLIILVGVLVYLLWRELESKQRPPTTDTGKIVREMREISKGMLIEEIDLLDSIQVKKGGLGEVWIYESPRKVVVKFPRTDNERIPQDTIDHRFKTEIEQHKKLQHQNVVPFVEGGWWKHPISKQKTRYLIQDFVDGCTLKTIIKCCQDEPLYESIILEITSQILDALEYIHSQSVLHRDLSWKNIMVDAKGQLYLIDFGNATTLEEDRTRNMVETNPDKKIKSVGSKFFYPPVDIEKDPNTAARDFYALAILIYFMYGGSRPIGTKETEYRTSVIENLKKMSNVPEYLKKTLKACLRGYSKDVSQLRKDLQLPSYHLAQIVQKASNAGS